MGRLTTGERCWRGVGGDMVRVSGRPASSRGGWGGFGLVCFGFRVWF